MKRYAIWDKQSNVYTPAGETLTPEEWIAQYSWINAEGAVPIVAKGLINGAYCGELNQMKTMSIDMGNENFTDEMTNEEILQCIEDYEDYMNTPQGPSTQERIAASMEYQNLLAE